MPAFNLSKSVSIDASLSSVYALVRDFRSWPLWSPWQIVEPDCKLVYREDGKGYTWDGAILGSGEMLVEEEEEDSLIVCKLTFLKPWKSVSKVSFDFSARGGPVDVTWSMEGSLPFFLFWMKKMMTVCVGMDYARGLAMLKDLAESGYVPSQLNYEHGCSFAGFRYLGERGSCSLAEIGPRLQGIMEAMEQWLGENGVEGVGTPFALYHKFDQAGDRVEYTVGYAVSQAPANPPAKWLVGEVPPLETYAVTHQGPYRHVSNAWAAGMMRARAKVFKQGKQFVPFEVYENDPREVAEHEILATVHFPLK